MTRSRSPPRRLKVLLPQQIFVPWMAAAASCSSTAARQEERRPTWVWASRLPTYIPLALETLGPSGFPCLPHLLYWRPSCLSLPVTLSSPLSFLPSPLPSPPRYLHPPPPLPSLSFHFQHLPPPPLTSMSLPPNLLLPLPSSSLLLLPRLSPLIPFPLSLGPKILAPPLMYVCSCVCRCVCWCVLVEARCQSWGSSCHSPTLFFFKHLCS